MEELIELCKKQSKASDMLLGALLHLQAHWPVVQRRGICGNTQYILELHTTWYEHGGAELDDFLFLLWPSWEYWTGSDTYPVPASKAERSLWAANNAYSTFEEWGDSTEYGQLRLDLLNHCIVTLQEAIERAKD